MRSPLVAVGVAALLALAGCGGTPRESPPTGLDELVVPTPDPDPADFTADVDNPRFPLPDGAAWTYEAPDGSTVELAVSGTDEVDGVPVTLLSRVVTDAGGEVVGERRSAYAQDRDGNVWSLGRTVLSGEGESWRAGVDDARAGLLVPAEPRTGDGWLQQSAPTLTTRVRVLAVDDDELETEDVAMTSDGEERVVRTYATGVGITRVADPVTDEVLLELVERSGG